MGPGVVAPRDEGRTLGLNGLHRKDDVPCALDAGRIALRSNDDEIVVHHGIAFHACPSTMNFSSASLACTNTTSASPRRAMSSACPVPRATTLTSMAVFRLNSGRMKPNSPESSVEVVEATTMDFFCAEASETCARTKAIANKIRLRRLGIQFLPWGSPR